jgi:predicted DNA-binding protein
MTVYSDEEMARLADDAADKKITFDVDKAGKVELPPPAEGEAMTAVSLRLPLGVYQRIKELAADKGLKPTALMRDWIQEGLAGSEEDVMISVTDLLRVVASLPKQTPGMAA